jgi:carboxyl-terminal processing protease
MPKKGYLTFAITGLLLLIIGFVLGVNTTVRGSLPFGINLPFVNFENAVTRYRISGMNPPAGFQDADFGVFWEVWNVLERNFYEPHRLDANLMIEGATAGMVRALGDPYTIFLPHEENVISGEDLAGSFYGIGIELGYRENYVAVISPLSGTPAERAGLQPGDLIIHVRDDLIGVDESTSSWSLIRAQSIIRGRQRFSPIVLTIFREDYNNNIPFEVEIERDEIIVRSVTLEFVEYGGDLVAHIRLSRFGDRTGEEWNEAVDEILQNRHRISGVVLDMRNGPGGYFDEAIRVASEFIPDGTVVTQRGLLMSQVFGVTGRGRLFDVPLVVLVNRGSASASEIVAGALRDRLGTPLVGERTFGKGSVQQRIEVTGGAGVHVTVAQWELPGGENIGDEGLEMDVEVRNDSETEEDNQLHEAIRVLNTR